MVTDNEDYSGRAIRGEMAQMAFGAAVGAALMLYVGFGMNMRGTSDSGFYNGSVAAFTWTMKGGGVLMGVSALLLYLGWRPVLLVDALLTAAMGVILLGVGGVWLVSQDWEGVLSLVFGAMFLGAAKRSWMLHNAAGRAPLTSFGDRARETPDASSREASQAGGEARQAAMDRLLLSKRREAAPETPEVSEPVARPVEKPRGVQAEPRPVTTRRELPNIEPAPKAAVQAKKDEPPPEGFLAQLGRDEE